MKSYLAEAIGTFALIFVGVAAIQNAGDNLLAVALAHGLTIAVMVSATGALSGGHLNPAVTFAVWLGGKIPTARAVRYVVAQLIGAVAAGLLARLVFSEMSVINGTPGLSRFCGFGQGVVLEAVLT